MKDKGRKQSGQAADRSWELRPYSTVSSGFRLELLARRAVLGRFSRWGALAQPECPQGGILLRGDPPMLAWGAPGASRLTRLLAGPFLSSLPGGCKQADQMETSPEGSLSVLN